MKKWSKQQFIDFTILSFRWYLAVYMYGYGYSKLTGGQFGVKPEIMEQPLKDVSKFYLAWHLFSLSKVFNIAVGISQIIGAALIVFNRTAIIGTLFLLPVLINIFLIDVSFTMGVFGISLPLRLAGMIACAICILIYYNDRIILAWKNLTQGISTKLRYRWWVFLLLPVIGKLMDLVIGLVTWPVKLIFIWLYR